MNSAAFLSESVMSARDAATKVLPIIKRRGMQLARSDSSIYADHFDSAYPANEQLPRKFKAIFFDDGGTLRISIDQTLIGSPLTDKSRVPDGYRFHDAFHICNAALLSWSPVWRSLLRRRRTSNLLVNDVEDGGRAQMIEEAICHVVYDYGQDHDLSHPDQIDRSFVDYVIRLAGTLEVAACSAVQWSNTISAGYTNFLRLRECNGGILSVDLDERSIVFKPVE